MLILAIDTTGPLASCALSDGLQIEQIINDTEYSHLEEIVPMVKRLLAEQKVQPEELDAIAVSRGPGSFTGIRIGMATAKGLAQIWDKPIVCVPTLDSFAYGREQEKLHDKNIRFTLTTNGVLLDDEVTEFCNREMHNRDLLR